MKNALEQQQQLNKRPNYPDILFGLSQYLSAYRCGVYFVEDRITDIMQMLKQSGEFRKE